MHVKTSLLAVALAAVSLVSFTVGAHEPQSKQMKGQDMAGMDMKAHSEGSMEMHKIMMSGTKMPMKMTGNVDRDFASMMIMHHQMAIKMADVQIKDGSNAQLKAMARKMKAAQQAEIKQLSAYTK